MPFDAAFPGAVLRWQASATEESAFERVLVLWRDPDRTALLSQGTVVVLRPTGLLTRVPRTWLPA